jgi:RND family efflux transporter MFP subunit
MRSKLFLVLIGMVLLAVMGFAYRAMTRNAEVAVTTVKAETVERVLAAVGRIRADQSLSVYPRVAGLVTNLSKEEGDTVKAGDVLGEIDASQSRAALNQALASVASLQRKLAQSTRDLARVQALADSGFATRATREAAQLVVDRDREELARLSAAAQEARSRLEDFVIRAPISGQIVLRPIDPGQVVDLRTQIFQLVSRTEPEVETDIDETVAGALRVGMNARLSPAGTNGRTFEGKVKYVADRIEPTTGGRTIRLSFNAAPTDLPPGLSVDINVSVDTTPNALAIPRAAIAEPDTAPYVVVIQDHQAVRKPVTFIDWPAERVIITSGIAAGDRIAVAPATVPAGKPLDPVESVDTP